MFHYIVEPDRRWNWLCEHVGGCVNVHVVFSVCWIKVIRGLDMQINNK